MPGFGGIGGRLRLSAVAQACRLDFLGTLIFKVRCGELLASFGFEIRKCFSSHDFFCRCVLMGSRLLQMAPM